MIGKREGFVMKQDSEPHKQLFRIPQEYEIFSHIKKHSDSEFDKIWMAGKSYDNICHYFVDCQHVHDIHGVLFLIQLILRNI